MAAADSPRRRYFKSADEFRTKTRNPDLARWDVPLGGPESELPNDTLGDAKSEVRKDAPATPTGRLSGVMQVLKQWEKHLPARRKANDDSSSVVYFVRADHVIKIGIAANVDKRLRELQTANASRLQLLGTIPGGRSKELELHERFSHLRLCGEWFSASPELLECIAALVSR